MLGQCHETFVHGVIGPPCCLISLLMKSAIRSRPIKSHFLVLGCIGDERKRNLLQAATITNRKPTSVVAQASNYGQLFTLTLLTLEDVNPFLN
jgi:hypothetical protein